MALVVTVNDSLKKGEVVRIRSTETVQVETPAGNVYISYDARTGAMVLVRGEKATTTVKFNEKAVV